MSLNAMIEDSVENCNFLIKGEAYLGQYQQIIIPMRYISGIDSEPTMNNLFYDNSVSLAENYARKLDKPIIIDTDLAIKLHLCKYWQITKDLHDPFIKIIRELNENDLYPLRKWKVISND